VIKTHFPYQTGRIEIDLDANKTDRIFLDNTASTQLPLSVYQNLGEFLFTYANVHRGEYDASQVMTEEFERAYNMTANLVNANSWR